MGIGRQPPPYPAIWATPPRGRVLALAPHADDETLGCGGVLIRHREQGDPVRVVCVTDGAAGDPLGYYSGRDYPELRREEARRAGAILGVDDLVFWDYPDGRLAEAHDLAQRLAALFDAYRPDIIYRPSTAEIHPDHWALGVATEEALHDYRRAVGDYCFEAWATVRPSYVIDISAVWERKRQAIEQYQSQLRYNDYVHMIEGLNAYRTIYLSSARYMEAFESGFNDSS
ncbi:4-oxalmesaconate hydratase [Candidatus Methylomirabilis lanthanidiphila]|uniref:4-oxalmesaconate hydratase n=1 Tax=Candidatus Methylomirabilis lanthanidiphila TaxID=2211376 RepID=A0A564ZKJ3_9BACT|nr:PIG-L family deacetylase [Candidatus Methylomirabilis lanthanidiphila]VUZ85703.1 4-oxalmesaconate hydratase [Candidatus Methylomirabilis lanthanidiphila]